MNLAKKITKVEVTIYLDRIISEGELAELTFAIMAQCEDIGHSNMKVKAKEIFFRKNEEGKGDL
jgi:hypothetical protein